MMKSNYLQSESKLEKFHSDLVKAQGDKREKSPETHPSLEINGMHESPHTLKKMVNSS
jgi:hypothetical protein